MRLSSSASLTLRLADEKRELTPLGPPFFAGYVLDNYLAVHDAFQFDKATWRRIAQNGIDGSWCSDERKAAMSAQLAAVLGEWEGKEI